MTYAEAIALAAQLGLERPKSIQEFAAACDRAGLVIGVCNATGDWIVLRDGVEAARVK